ncbi:NAD(P)/FAD-dependent oxidoreductase [Falsiroseomonas selenitidurans]|uniref:FAD-binding oxidoreductase n=1 Tax=Falsiroseomonas selenitidurans TaxID=2716335 RepID=A0ABX1E195_9PROT|nr:FAD-binding oxidoreductase [Falsiroseomonas selenitidurans]NKC30816.1 FAD-binding oxidoreductase [Falsiroseomonas selenitidurans]
MSSPPSHTGLFDVAIIGGGMVGSAIGYGCAERGARVAVLDEGDVALRAARGNFGLVWSQSKGDGMPAYAAWTRQSVALWPALAERASALAGRDVQYRAVGGLTFCLDEAEYAARAHFVQRMHNQGQQGLVMLDRRQLQDLMPGCPLGPAVRGASYQPADGHVDPLTLLRGLQAGMRAAGGVHLPGAAVEAIDPIAGGYRLRRADGSEVSAQRVVIAAGVLTTKLAQMVGLDVPVRPVRGQNIVTERLAPILPLPASAIRQTGDGTVQIGVTSEDDGSFATGTTVDALSRMAGRALRVLPVLAQARMVRGWAALRPMTPDGFPAYAESTTHPGAFVATCHSGVTLAAVHAGPLAGAILTGALPEHARDLHPDRFVGMTDVSSH